MDSVRETVIIDHTQGGAVSSRQSAVSWAAVLGGASVAGAVTLALAILGIAFGLVAASPYDGEGASAAAFTFGAAVWLVFMQWASGALGGYVAGRMRCRWEGTDADELYFRDTAHGLLTWAVATLIVAFLAVSAGTMGASASIKAMQDRDTSATEMVAEETTAYYIDGMFRGGLLLDDPARAEITRAFVQGVSHDAFPAEDRAYLTAVVAARTGLDAASAQARVDGAITRAEADKQTAIEAADTARKTSATASLVTFVSMMLGALMAGFAAVVGGRHRDIV